ncbi:hypothetical protein LCGC14_2023580, partial [marine sediment metagenome]
MATAGNIVDGAFKLCGVLLPTSTERTSALTTLNDLLALWSAERLLVYFVVEESFTLVVGTNVYTIGSAGTFNTVRPQKITAAYLRDSDNIDYPLDVTMALTEYNRISDKGTNARPERLYYAPEFPLGKIHFDSPPDATYTFNVFSWKPLTSFADLDSTTIVIPAEYVKALRYHLAVDLAPELTVALDPLVIQQTVVSRDII